MNSAHTTIDISNKPELLRLAEEVRTSGKPRLLKNHRETVAVLMPAETVRQDAGKRKQTAYEPFLASPFERLNADLCLSGRFFNGVNLHVLTSSHLSS